MDKELRRELKKDLTNTRAAQAHIQDAISLMKKTTATDAVYGLEQTFESLAKLCEAHTQQLNPPTAEIYRLSDYTRDSLPITG